uniref:Protein quiver n=1 Tax=Acrobeloides nanus TaxID=290746 RepID=A0A914CJX9_9BILA
MIEVFNSLLMNCTAARTLYCMTCVPSITDTTQLDKFRVRQNLKEPKCESMEPVECLPQEDTCVTITMQIAPKRFWIGSGCDQRVNYVIPAEKDGCWDLTTLSTNRYPGFVEERRAIQRVCLCGTQFCNSNGSIFGYGQIKLFLPFFTILYLHVGV